MIFRRPELEKDNPIAPEPYVGPRRRLAMARAAALGKLTEEEEEENVMETLQVLTEAASRVANGLLKIRKANKDLKALRAAIVQAERVLSAEGGSRSYSRVKIS